MKALIAALLVAASCATTTAPPERKPETTAAPASSPPAVAAPSCRLAHDQAPPERKREIIDAMQTVKRDVQACFAQYRQLGELDVTIDVAADGTIEGVRGDGQLAGTDTARCAADAIRPVHLPASADAYSVCYPYVLR